MPRIGNFKIDGPKAIEAMVYIANHAPVSDIYHMGKIFYFADRAHLERYGRLICGDSYIAMKDGPVPSLVYDFIKDVRNKRTQSSFYGVLTQSFTVEDGGEHRVTALRRADLNLLSESDLECIDASIAENGNLTFGQLWRKSHDAAYHSASRDNEISLEAIVDSLPSAAELKNYLTDRCPG